jgi:MSHA pilin protein MshA
MKSRLHQGGFTVIELIVVITILGILATFAVPRFAALEREARAESAQTLADSLRSRAALSHALWLAENEPSTVDMDGAPIEFVNGYPSLATIDDTLQDLSGFTYDGATGVFTKVGIKANCTVTYALPAFSGAAPTIAVALTGC